MLALELADNRTRAKRQAGNIVAEQTSPTNGKTRRQRIGPSPYGAASKTTTSERTALANNSSSGVDWRSLIGAISFIASSIG
jgi:hypothetical protein